MATRKMDNYIFNLKFASKQMARNANKLEKIETSEKRKCKWSLLKGDIGSARIHAENAIRFRNQALNYRQMSSRVDAVASNLQSSMLTRNLNKTMIGVSKAMVAALKTMDIDRIATVMDNFEKNFENMSVHQDVINQTMDQSIITSLPTGQVDNLLTQIAEENGLEIKLQLPQPQSDAPGASSTLERTKLKHKVQ